MHPFLTLTAGVAVGAIGVRLAKSAKPQVSLQSSASSGIQAVRSGLAQTQSGARDAAVSGLSVIEKASASLRQKLGSTSTADSTSEPASASELTPTPTPASEPVPEKAPSRPSGRKAGTISRKTMEGQNPA